MKKPNARPSTVVVRVFGTAEIRIGERIIGLSAEAMFALALYLTTRAGERIPRSEALDTFWPTGEPRDRRHRMGQMLFRLRRLGMPLVETPDAIGVDKAMVDSDIGRALQPDWPESASPTDVEAALLHQLAFSSRMPLAFLSWLDELQAMLAQRARRAAIRLITESRNEGRWGDVEHWAEALLRSDSLNEEATLALAEAAAMLGSKAHALEILDAYICELGADAERLGRPAIAMRRRLAERRMGWTKRGAREVPLVGREQVIARLTHALSSDPGTSGRSILVLGASGFGKSRLLHEARDIAALRGIRILDLRADSAETSHPWSLVRALIRGLIDSPGSAAVAPHIMAAARAVARPDAQTGSLLSIVPEMTAGDVIACVTPLLAAVSDECRLLITIDDLHRSDEYSVPVIGRVMAELPPTRCTAIAAARPGARIQRLLSEGQHGVQAVRLTPLSSAECRLLANSTATANNFGLSEADLDAIAMRAGGHPHFARELALARSRGARFDAMPLSLAAIVDSTLALQSPEALRLLRITALLGDTATTSRVQKASDLQSHIFLTCIESLSDDAIIHLDNDRTIRIHDSWRDAIMASMPDVTAAALALECASALANDAEPDDYKMNRRLASLYWTAGESTRATQLNIASIDTLLSSGLYSAALESAEALGAMILEPTSRLRMRAREALALLGSGRPGEALALSEHIWRSRGLQSPPLLAEQLLAVSVSADAHVRLNRADDGPAEELVLLARSETLDAAARARACLTGIRLTGNFLDTDQFREFERIGEELAQQLPSSPAVALTRLIAAAELRSASDILEAQKVVDQIDHGSLSVGDRCLLLRCSANALRIAGRAGDAVDSAASAVRLAEEHSMMFAASTAAELLASILLDDLDIPSARRWLDGKSGRAPECGTPRTLSSRDHTRDRLELAEGRFDLLARNADDRVACARTFGQTRGRYAELALAAAVYAGIGRATDAERLLPEILHAATGLLGRFAADHTLDMCLQAAEGTNLRDRSFALAERHLKLRASAGVGGLPRICVRLRDLQQRLP